MTYIKIENNEIKYPPITLINGKECISPFKNNIPKMIEYGYFDCEHKLIDDYILGKLIIQNNEFIENPEYIEHVRTQKNIENQNHYTEALKTPVKVDDETFFVLAEWTNTYSNALIKAQNIIGDITINIPVINTLGKLENINVTNIDEIKKLYNSASDEWVRLINIRNGYLILIQNATLEELESLNFYYI